MLKKAQSLTEVGIMAAIVTLITVAAFTIINNQKLKLVDMSAVMLTTPASTSSTDIASTSAGSSSSTSSSASGSASTSTSTSSSSSTSSASSSSGSTSTATANPGTSTAAETAGKVAVKGFTGIGLGIGGKP